VRDAPSLKRRSKLDYTFPHGLLYPVKAEGVPETLEMLAMAPAVMAEGQSDGEGFRYYVGDVDLKRSFSA
jgi:hypothetical protein